MRALVLCFVLVVFSAAGASTRTTGYQFIEVYSHTTIPFEQYKDLIIISILMNDSINLRLVLDTGTRSLLVYGRRFRKLQNLHRERRVKVVGWGSPKGVEACLSYPNSVSLGKIRGDELGI